MALPSLVLRQKEEVEEEAAAQRAEAGAASPASVSRSSSSQEEAEAVAKRFPMLLLLPRRPGGVPFFFFFFFFFRRGVSRVDVEVDGREIKKTKLPFLSLSISPSSSSLPGTHPAHLEERAAGSGSEKNERNVPRRLHLTPRHRRGPCGRRPPSIDDCLSLMPLFFFFQSAVFLRCRLVLPGGRAIKGTQEARSIWESRSRRSQM